MTPEPGGTAQRGAAETRARWDAFAQSNAEFYITGHRDHASREDFLRSGREIVDPVVRHLGPQRTGGRLLEIGCGIGRTAQAFAEHFEHVDGADISPTMIERARALDPPPNVTYTVVSGADLAPFPDAAFDVVFSFVVLQHVRDPAVIASVLQEVGRVARSGATLVVQFDTRPLTPPVRALFALPDPVLPRTRRRGMRRNRRRPEWVRSQLARAGFGIEAERDRWLAPLGPTGTSAYHFFIARRI